MVEGDGCPLVAVPVSFLLSAIGDEAACKWLLVEAGRSEQPQDVGVAARNSRSW